eukprot:g9977.t1
MASSKEGDKAPVDGEGGSTPLMRSVSNEYTEEVGEKSSDTLKCIFDRSNLESIEWGDWENLEDGEKLQKLYDNLGSQDDWNKLKELLNFYTEKQVIERMTREYVTGVDDLSSADLVTDITRGISEVIVSEENDSITIESRNSNEDAKDPAIDEDKDTDSKESSGRNIPEDTSGQTTTGGNANKKV